MDLKQILGDEYKEDLTAEQVNKLLEGKKLVDNSDGGYVDKKTFDNTASDLSKLKKQVEILTNEKKVIEDKGLTETQLLTKQIGEIKTQLAAEEKKAKKASLKASFVSELGEEGAETIVSVLMDGADPKDALNVFKSLKQTTVDKVKTELLKQGSSGLPAGSGTVNPEDVKRAEVVEQVSKSKGVDFISSKLQLDNLKNKKQ